jgi:bifunctional N-acetylglucosamine-1-phosphate-uridyltransferase/glucosamine-1-phosphate-acetyltransferase GlmU-like protein
MKDHSFDIAPRRVCAVVPAAGRGSRLGIPIPKIFVPILPSVTIWDAIHDKLSPMVDHIVLVLSPDGQAYREKNPADFNPESFAKTEIGLQSKPLGMGDAIFGVGDLWREYENILIVWGDQFNLSLCTLQACLDIHSAQKKPSLTLPMVRAANPYVEYIFDSSGRLTKIRQTREGDRCEPGGFSDIGVFLLNGGRALLEEWDRYRAIHTPGSVTGEINFLPFLTHLSSTAGWPVNKYETDDPNEAIGINTPDDLALARRLLQKNPPPAHE